MSQKGKKILNPPLPTPEKVNGDLPREISSKKPFVEPKLTRHEALPEVTTGFIGTFSP